MKPKYQQLLANCPNPTVFVEEPDLPPSIDRPTMTSMFISDFRVPGWQVRSKSVESKQRHRIDGGLIQCGANSSPTRRRKRTQAVEAPKISNHLRAAELLCHHKSLAKSVEMIREKIGADRSALFLLDEATNELVCEATSDHPQFRIPSTSGIVGYVLTTGGILNLKDAYKYPLFNPAVDKKSGYRTKALFAIPILGEDNVVCGVVEFINKKQGTDACGLSVFTMNDMHTIRDMLGEGVAQICPLPLHLTASSFCPMKLRHSYQDQFTPSEDLLIDTTRERRS